MKKIISALACITFLSCSVIGASVKSEEKCEFSQRELDAIYSNIAKALAEFEAKNKGRCIGYFGDLSLREIYSESGSCRMNILCKDKVNVDRSGETIELEVGREVSLEIQYGSYEVNVVDGGASTNK